MTMKTEGRIGDPRFLTVLDNCIERRCKILGIEAPKRLDLSSPEGQSIEVKHDLKKLGDEELWKHAYPPEKK